MSESNTRAEIVEVMARAAYNRRWPMASGTLAWDRAFDRDKWLLAMDAALTALEASGRAVVPREPTREMLEAGHMADERNYDGSTPIRLVWSAMLAAALPPSKE